MKKWAMFFIVCCSLVIGLIEPKAVSASYAVIDAQTSRLLKGVNEQERLPIASLTKIWTAYVTLQYANLDDVVTISDEAVRSEGSSIYLQAGEQRTVEELLYGLMLRSGNDAAYALAEHVGGSAEGFVYLMNEQAEMHGLQNTTFTNPSGLHHEKHLSSAYDTAKMLQIALENDDFKKIASTKVYKGTVAWQNKHRLLHQNVGAVAGKTGYTKVAGRTLATFFEREQKQMIVVTLNEGNDWNFHRYMADEIDAQYEMVTIAKRGTYTVNDLKLTLKEPIQLLVKKDEEEKLKHIVHVSTLPTSKRAVWHVFLDGQSIASTMVEKK